MNPNGRKILVVDDNIQFADIMVQILENHGFRVSMASNGNMAIEKVSSENPELVLLDLKLPDIPGEEVLKKIKEIKKDIGVIIVTGFGGEQTAVDMMRKGAMDFLSKPVESETLLRAVKNTLKMRDAQHEDEQRKGYSSLENFFPFLAHEIRNPLHAISGALAIIERKSDLNDKFLAQSVKIIQEEVKHLNEFVQECLNFVRPPTKSRLTEVEINEVISIAINIISHMFEGFIEKIKISTAFDPKLPKIYIDYQDIMRVLLNIMKNAFEAMEGGGECIIKTALKSNFNSDSIGIVFIDNGAGIKKENLKNLFQPFFTTKVRGNGLGLAICKRIIVERHHGKIHIESEENKGTTVTIELPIHQDIDMAGVRQS